MKGFCEQKTIFPVVYTIVDDSSTDGAQGVILHFLEENFKITSCESIRQKETDDYILHFAQNKSNVNCFFLVLLLKYNHYQIRKSKDPYISRWLDNSLFVATCEGDDYWTDPYKLQKQVDFLEKHDNCSACATNSMIIDENGKNKSKFSQQKSRFIKSMDEIVIKRQFHTASVLWRNRCLKELYGKFTWDTYWWCTLLANGLIWYDDTVTCVYRKAGQGVTSTTARLKWIEINENWSNILYEQFGPEKLSYEGAYISLTRDILTSLIQGGLPKEEKALLRQKYRKYRNVKMDLLNIPFILKVYRNKIIRLIKRV